MSSTLKQQIIQARTAKKMTQAQLAQVRDGARVAAAPVLRLSVCKRLSEALLSRCQSSMALRLACAPYRDVLALLRYSRQAAAPGADRTQIEASSADEGDGSGHMS